MSDDDAARQRMQRLAADWRRKLDDLERVVREIDEARNALVRERLAELQQLAKAAGGAREKLLALVGERGDLFAKPRSASFMGISFGWRKMPGSIRVAKDAVDLVKRKLAGKAGELIRTTEQLDRTAARRLTARELMAIGCEVTEARDAPFATADTGDAEAVASDLIRAAAPAEA